MAQGQVTITLPISEHALGTILFVVGVIILLVIVFMFTGRKAGKNWISQLQEKTGLSGLHPIFVAFVALLWSVLFFALLAGIFWVLYGALARSMAVTPEEGGELRWYLLTLTAITAALGAVISFPFTLIRMHLNRRQTETAEQGLITDRINKAVAGLGADKTIKRQRLDDSGNPAFVMIDGKTDVSQPIMEEVTKPNLEVRIGAIYALERIAQDSDRDHVQIMEILCAYIRENAPGAEAVDWPEIEMRTGEDDGPLEEDWEARVKAFKKEQNELKATLNIRTDIQVALEVIGRRSAYQRGLEAKASKGKEGDPFVFDIPCPEPDLPGEAHDPKALDAYNVKLEKWRDTLSQYQGYRLDLRGANLRGADLSGLNLSGARLQNTKLQGANLWGVKLQGAELWEAKLQGAELRWAQLQGAEFMRAKMQGADLWKAKLQGAELKAVEMDSGTDISAASLRGAALISVDYSTAPQITEHLKDVYGDGSVILPETAQWPEHWPKHTLEWDEFYKEWRKWQANPEEYQPPEE